MSEMGILKLAVHCVYEQIDKALDELQKGEQKKAVALLRSILPKQYRHTFVVEKMK